MTKTRATKASEIQRKWHLVDAKNQILGRLASQVAGLLIGKAKPNFASYLDGGDFVVVINAGKIKVTGRKMAQKKYYRHSGYPGGFKEITLGKQMEKDPRKVIRHAVKGMLPKNKHQKPRLARLKIFVDEKHSFKKKFKN